MTSTKAVLIPGDIPPSEPSIKRQLLFFDSLLVPDPNDAAILNQKEIAETFPDGSIVRWGTIGPYPRSVAYKDQYLLLLARAEPAIRRGKLQVTTVAAGSPREASNNWVSTAAAMKREILVRAALPDYAVDVSAAGVLNSSVGGNMVVPSRTGYESKYSWLTKVDAQAALPMDEFWRRVAMGRLGRVMKTIRHATNLGAIPLAVDNTNQNICLALGSEAYGNLPTPGQLSSAAVALDTVDPVVLDAALDTLSWSEVLRIRKEVLPFVAKLRGLLAASVKVAGKPQNASLDHYLVALKELKTSFQKAQDEVTAAWRKIGIKTVEAGVAALPAGLSAFAPNTAWTTPLIVIAGGLIYKALQGSIGEAETILRGKQTLKASPLFAFDRLVRLGKSELKKGSLQI